MSYIYYLIDLASFDEQKTRQVLINFALQNDHDFLFKNTQLEDIKLVGPVFLSATKLNQNQFIVDCVQEYPENFLKLFSPSAHCNELAASLRQWMFVLPPPSYQEEWLLHFYSYPVFKVFTQTLEVEKKAIFWSKLFAVEGWSLKTEKFETILAPKDLPINISLILDKVYQVPLTQWQALSEESNLRKVYYKLMHDSEFAWFKGLSIEIRSNIFDELTGQALNKNHEIEELMSLLKNKKESYL